MVQNGEVLIVDEFTGRILDGRRYSEGLHQAIEAKEKVPIREENQTLATITLQNYFRMYEVLSGMTGTAKTEEDEFRQIYGLEVVQIPTNAPMVRKDENDYIFTTAKEKFAAVVDDIVERYEKGQPVLVGTVSVEVSEMLSRLLERHGVPAQRPQRQAARARGRDHQERRPGRRDHDRHQHGRPRRRHQARRGRASRPAACTCSAPSATRAAASTTSCAAVPAARATPARARFYLSAEDELIRLFAGDRMYRVLSRLGPKEGEPLEARMLSNAVERAQVKVEELNFMRRKNVLKYDEVMNEQRRVIYDQRQRILMGEDFGEQVREMIGELVEAAVRGRARRRAVLRGVGPRLAVHRPQADLRPAASRRATSTWPRPPWTRSSTSAVDDALAQYDERERLIGAEQMRTVERAVMLQVIDSRWKDHLLDMDYLQEGIHLRALGQRDPLVEYKNEGFELFQDMIGRHQDRHHHHADEEPPRGPGRVHVHDSRRAGDGAQLHERRRPDHADVVHRRRHGRRRVRGGRGRSCRRAAAERGGRRRRPARRQHAPAAARHRRGTVTVQQRIVYDKVGRNDPCPCGSGKKYKKCHGA